MSNWAKHQEDTIGLPVYKRARHGIHFDKGDGEILANFSGKPCHFQDTDGLWKPIDTKLLPLGDGYYGCPHSKVKVHPDGHVAVAGTGYIQRVTLPSAQAGLLDGDKLVRKFSFGEQRMWVTEDGFKSEIQLNRIPTLTEARKLIASESGTLSKEYLKSLTTATDANGNVHTYSTLTAFRTWLASAVFPVVIDPDFSGATADMRVRSLDAQTWANARANGYWINNSNATDKVGDNSGTTTHCIYRLFLKFDTSSIDDGQSISQVNLKLVATADATTSGDFDVQIVKQNWSAYESAASGSAEADAMFDACLAGTADSSIWRNTNGMSVNTQYTSGNLATDWVSKTGATYYSLRASFDYDNTEPTGGEQSITLALANHGTADYRPVLTVTYTAGGSITPIVQYYNRLRRN